MRRSFLVLQGTASPFFGRLAVALRHRGHVAHRVNFCGGDLFYAGKGESWNYTHKAEELRAWYADRLQAHRPTDILMFGDCRYIHQCVNPAARDHGVRVHVFEEGYVRPHWVTLEQHGVNGRSLLPRDPAWYREQGRNIPAAPRGRPTGYNLRERALHDIWYRAANVLYQSRFPFYKSHRPRNGLIEYAGLANRALHSRRHRRHAEDSTGMLLAAGRQYYLFPLQLNSDSQIVEHSPFDGMVSAIDRVMRSFARHAPAQAWLVIKNHPLDTGLIDYRRHASRVAQELGMTGRFVFLDAGHLPTLLEHARGAVVVNSTVGLSALHHRRPLIALGTAIYDMDGLTWQGSLDDFWTQGSEPDTALYRRFLDYVVHTTQINGDFYTRTGMAMATEGAVRRLEALTNV